MPLGVLFAVWLACRPFFIQAAAALLATSFAAALVFLVFPAAPPWLAVRAGLLHGVVRIRALDGAQGAHGTLQHLFDDNPVAAVPSLHAAYSLLVVLIVLADVAAADAARGRLRRGDAVRGRLPRRALRERPRSR